MVLMLSRLLRTLKHSKYDSTYAGIFSTDSDYFTIINITDPSSPSQVSVLDSTVNSTFDLTKIDYTVIDGSTYLISTSRSNDLV